MNIAAFNLFLGVMSLIALVVFIALYFVKAGYGIFRTASWGVAISNKLALDMDGSSRFPSDVCNVDIFRASV